MARDVKDVSAILCRENPNVRLSPTEIYKIAVSEWGRGKNAVVATAVAMAESTGRPCVVNPTPVSSGNHAVGLWQVVENIHGYNRNQLQNSYTNAKAAHEIWQRAGESFARDWAAYNNGAYKKFLNAAKKGERTSDVRSPGEFLQTAPGVGAISSVADALQWLSGGGFLRITQVTIGVLAFMIGISAILIDAAMTKPTAPGRKLIKTGIKAKGRVVARKNNKIADELGRQEGVRRSARPKKSDEALRDEAFSGAKIGQPEVEPFD